MNSIVVLLALGGAACACAAAVAGGLVLVPRGGAATLWLAAAGAAFHSAMILLDLRSTAAFGLAAVVRDERSILYRRLAGRIGLAGGGACMWALDWFLAWIALPAMLVGTVHDPRASGLFLLVLGAIHAFGWLSNRALGRRNAAAAESGPA